MLIRKKGETGLATGVFYRHRDEIARTVNIDIDILVYLFCLSDSFFRELYQSRIRI